MSRVLVVGCLIAWLPTQLVAFGSNDPNLAIGKPCQLQPAPNYLYCTDSSDRVQLTDGLLTQGYFWTQKSTVGWVNASPATITIDLGCVEPISGVSFNTAAGCAGVTWPSAILVLVSDDDEVYYPVGDLVTLSHRNTSPMVSGYQVIRYATDRLHTFGRYVKLLVVVDGPYTFVDEVEVFAGSEEWLRSVKRENPLRDISQFFANRQIEWGIAQTFGGGSYRCSRDSTGGLPRRSGRDRRTDRGPQLLHRSGYDDRLTHKRASPPHFLLTKRRVARAFHRAAGCLANWALGYAGPDSSSGW